jgi:phospholipid/cholesterol/gamma-HCH transport system substrate-binding protein
MKFFSERNPVIIGAVSIAILVGLVLAALQYDKLPFFPKGKGYEAYFADVDGLRQGAAVLVAGFRVGQVTSIELDGPRVLIKFNVDKSIVVGDRNEAAIHTKSLLGAKVLEVTPRGDGQLSGPIPIDRTTPPYQLPDALGDLSDIVSGLNTHQLSDSLATLAQTFADTPASLKEVVEGATRFADTLNARDAQLSDLFVSAKKATAVVAQRSDQLVGLIDDTNALLVALRTQSDALDHISANISYLSRQLRGFIAENKAQLRPALDKLNGVLTIVDNRKERVQKSIKLLNAYAMSLGESVSSGPFFKAYLVNLLPGQFVQPFVDAAFSDLGLDPNVLLPSERIDPPTGQPATPALPVPYPRTGQGGEPRLTLPDAITGKPGDPRYPYREPPPAPPPGGPPPGPPALTPPELQSTPEPTPSPVNVAPGQMPPGLVQLPLPGEAGQ